MCAVILLACHAGVAEANPAAAAAVPPAAAMATKGSIPGVGETMTFVQEVAAVPKHAGEILYLPLGVVECVFCPLPEVEFKSGLGHIGTGLLAPFRLVEAVVTLPYDAVTAVIGTVNAVPKAAGLPAIVPAP